ncbi:DUF4344 domain-containing metallopeptidase [Thioclava atlantica]|nr:DUF4344 domain-containing metallopeptidase [Thioclava atlantica]
MRWLFSVFLVALTAGSALAGVHISDRYEYTVISSPDIEVPARQFVSYKAHIPTSGTLSVSVAVLNKTFNDGSFWVCDASGYQALYAGRAAPSCRGMERTRGHFYFTYNVDRPGDYYLVADNRFSMLDAKHYAFEVRADIRTPDRIRQGYTGLLTLISRAEQEVFSAPQINFSMKPCGTANAYSKTVDGSIVVCSELAQMLEDQGNTKAIVGIMFHEMGHSLLNLWGLPNWGNEQTVDEFSAYMMMRYLDDSYIKADIDFFSNGNTQQEVANMVKNGDPHPLSIQRVRNLQAILKNRTGFMQRWNRALYPHMKTSVLQGIAQWPTTSDDPLLAREILAQR